MTTATLLLRLWNGERQPFATDTLVRLFDGAQRLVHQAVHTQPTIRFILPFTDGPNDRYRIVVSARDHLDAGQVSVAVDDTVESEVDLMLLPRKSRFAFQPLSSLATVHRRFERLVADFLVKKTGAADEAAYRQLQESSPGGLATLLSISSAFAGFGSGAATPATIADAAGRHPLEFIGELQELENDRFLAAADGTMVDWLTSAPRTFSTALHGLHAGAYISFKETRYLEGNVQFTFSHTGHPDVVTVDSDIDLFRDGSHFLVEVIPTDFLHANPGTDPRVAYALRWMSVQRTKAATNLDFNPPFTVTAV